MKNIIKDWLEENRNPEIDAQVEKEALELHNEQLRQTAVISSSKMNKNIWKLNEDGKLHLSANNSDETFCGKAIESGAKAHHATSKINCRQCLKIVRVSMIYALTQIKISKV